MSDVIVMRRQALGHILNKNIYILTVGLESIHSCSSVMLKSYAESFKLMELKRPDPIDVSHRPFEKC